MESLTQPWEDGRYDTTWPLGIVLIIRFLVFGLILSEKTYTKAACLFGYLLFSDSCYFLRTQPELQERPLQVVAAVPTGAGAPPWPPSLPPCRGNGLIPLRAQQTQL